MLRRLLLRRRVNANQQEQAMLEEARHEAAGLVTAAALKADRIIREAHLFNRRIQNDLEKSLKQTSAEIALDNKEHLEKIRAGADEQLQTLLKHIESELTGQSEAFSLQLQQRLERIEQQLAGEMKREYQEALKSFEQQKAAQLTAFEAKMTKEWPALLRHSLGRALTPDVHQQIVREALAEIQKQHQWPNHA